MAVHAIPYSAGGLAFGFALGAFVSASGGWSPAFAQDSQTAMQSASSQVEEIYIARSLRETRREPTGFCGKTRTGFDAWTEDHYRFMTTAIDADGRILDANVKVAGSLHACLGKTPDPKVFSFYAEGLLGSTPFTGLGNCHWHKTDFPEPGLTAVNCFMDLSGLPAHYVGGLLTTNTMTSRATTGVQSDPAGYVQPSIATVRLWKQRPEQ